MNSIAKLCGVAGLSAVALLGVVKPAEAFNIWAGSDYWFTPAGGTSFDFGGPIGVVDFMGNPIDPANLGNTDTIVTRTEDCVFAGGSCTVDLEMQALSLQSVNQVNLNGSWFDVVVTLNDAINSVGQMTINHEFPDDNTPAAEGTFASNIDVSFKAEFLQNGQAFNTVFDTLNLQGNGLWSHDPDEFALLVPGPVGDLLANEHGSPQGGFDDFFPGFLVEEHPGQGVHSVRTACPIDEPCHVPEPLTILGSGLALAFGAVFKSQSDRKRENL